MYDLRDALQEFWSGFWWRDTATSQKSIPAFHDQMVMSMMNMDRPTFPAFPFITYEIVMPSFDSATICTANIWDRRNVPGFFGTIDNVFMQVIKRIPEDGVILRWDDGAVVMFRNRAAFTGYLDEPSDPLITRGIIRYELRGYIS